MHTLITLLVLVFASPEGGAESRSTTEGEVRSPATGGEVSSGARGSTEPKGEVASRSTSPAQPAPAPEGEEEVVTTSRERPEQTAPNVSAASTEPPQKTEHGDEIIVTGVRKKTTLLKTSHNVAIVGKREIKERSPVSIAEAIQNIPGVALFYKGAVFINPIIRGLGGRRVLMLLDGSILNSNKTMGVVGYFLDMNDVERIEVVRGPASVLFGSGALGGVINIVSKDPFKQKIGLSGILNTYYGTNNNEVMVYNRNTYNWGDSFVTLGLRFRQADNYTMGGGDEVLSSMFEDKNIFLKVGKRFGRHSLVLDMRGYFGTDMGKALDDMDMRKIRKIRFPHDRNYRGALHYHYRGAGFLRNAKATLYYSRTDRHQQVDLFTPGYERITTYTQKRGDIWNMGGNGSLLYQFKPETSLTLGIDSVYKQMDMDKEVWIEDWGAPGEFNSMGVTKEFKNTSQIQAGLFGQLKHQMGDLALTLALRGDFLYTTGDLPQDMDITTGVWEDNTTTLVAPSGSVGLLYRPRKSIAFKLNLSSAFRGPDLREIYFSGANCYGYTCGNTKMDPERSYNLDGGVLYKKRGYHLELNGFYYYVNDYINFGPKSPEDNAPAVCDLVYKNIQRARLTGGEISLRKVFPLLGRALKVAPYVKASYIYAEDLDTDKPLALIPPLSVTGGVRFFGKKYPGFGKYFLQVYGRFDAKQTRVAPDEEESEAYGILNARAGVIIPFTRVVDSVSITATGSNLLDKKYSPHLASPYKMGRQIKFNLAVRY